MLQIGFERMLARETISIWKHIIALELLYSVTLELCSCVHISFRVAGTNGLPMLPCMLNSNVRRMFTLPIFFVAFTEGIKRITWIVLHTIPTFPPLMFLSSLQSS